MRRGWYHLLNRPYFHGVLHNGSTTYTHKKPNFHPPVIHLVWQQKKMVWAATEIQSWGWEVGFTNSHLCVGGRGRLFSWVDFNGIFLAIPLGTNSWLASWSSSGFSCRESFNCRGRRPREGRSLWKESGKNAAVFLPLSLFWTSCFPTQRYWLLQHRGTCLGCCIPFLEDPSGCWGIYISNNNNNNSLLCKLDIVFSTGALWRKTASHSTTMGSSL